MKLLLRRLLLWTLNSAPARFTMRWLIPAFRFGGKPLSDIEITLIGQALQPGRCLLIKDPLKLSHILIGGKWSHAGIHTREVAGIPLIAEMGHADFQEVPLRKFLGKSRHVAVIAPDAWEGVGDYTPYLQTMAERAQILGYSSHSYDFTFSHGEKSLYCSELIYLADYEQRYQADMSDLIGLNHPYISPDGLYKAKRARVILEI